MTFLEELSEQRWDDHRFYHHSRINQSLHLVSALSFLVTYVLLFTHHAVFAILFGWTFSMCIRQVGHFFFEPKGYDDMNQATHEYKERVKVGFNLRRKVILHSAWALVPVILLIQPSFFGIFTPHTDVMGYLDHLARVWLVLAGAALVGRTIQLCLTRSVQTGLAWFTKILTDPFHDVKMYWRAPAALMRGEMIQPPHERTA
ncbi:MAG TPA: hypothetical protein VHJ20_16120 [Polyangia bacterium]|nr:hypothetical protein [Polyangia bacterium]